MTFILMTFIIMTFTIIGVIAPRFNIDGATKQDCWCHYASGHIFIIQNDIMHNVVFPNVVAPRPVHFRKKFLKLVKPVSDLNFQTRIDLIKQFNPYFLKGRPFYCCLPYFSSFIKQCSFCFKTSSCHKTFFAVFLSWRHRQDSNP
jgi:hypothetical protein